MLESGYAMIQCRLYHEAISMYALNRSRTTCIRVLNYLVDELMASPARKKQSEGTTQNREHTHTRISFADGLQPYIDS